MHSIANVKYLEGYKLELTFDDQSKKIADLSYLTQRGGVFTPFTDLDFFKQVKLDESHYTIVWPNGVDLCPDRLWEVSKFLEH